MMTAKPAKQPPLTARRAALRVLADLRDGRRTAREAIDALISRQPLSPADVALTTELVMGVIRHRLTLASVLGRFTRNRWPRINRMLQHILMLGGYQLIWLDGIPEFAAVHEAVEQARAEGGARTAGFVNAVLRQLQRDIEHRRLPIDDADPARAVPVDRRTCCQFRRAVLPDPEQSPTGHLAEATSHPAWLVSRWIATYGWNRARAVCQAGMHRPPIFLRPNALRTDLAGLIERLAAEAIDARPSPCGTMAVVDHAGPAMHSAAFADGLFQPQDPTAMTPVRQMRLQRDSVVLDLCAGLGTKTTQMAEAMHDRGAVLACDADESRLDALLANCRRLGHTSVRTVRLAELERAVADLPRLDWILIDAPCSNAGVLARRPEARYRLNARAIENLSRTQLDLLDRAAHLARPETKLCYSTCSIDPAENEEVAAAFAQSHRDWRLASSALTLPEPGETSIAWRDGGYWSTWVRE